MKLPVIPDWFYHIPQKSTKTDKSQVQLPPTSQIPGLSKLAEPHKEINFASRRLWIKDTDSDYIKLAKQGGRADLLKHHSPPPRKSPPAPCSQPEWFVHAPPSSKNKEAGILRPPAVFRAAVGLPPDSGPPGDSPCPDGPRDRPVFGQSRRHELLAPRMAGPGRVSKWYLPEYMIHEEFIPSPSNSKPGKLLHDPDKTALEKEVEDNEKENKGKLKLPEIADKKQKDKAFTKKTAQEDNLENKFPSMPLPKKNEPINFTKLIANGYAEDWIQQRKEWKKIQPNVKMKEPGDLVPLDEFQEALEKKELLRNSKSRGRKAISTKVDQNVTFRDPLTDSKAKTSFILNKFRDMPA
ncbi:uncharacterized protein C7orf57-like isoform X2 [Scyliorhinus torazame]|uniref:uncharacterized protein C7orf57-like isoform X2 n=1 Tax=Scyliorhinus torazame TaxID=75743 RepID=UPI003B5B65F4